MQKPLDLGHKVIDASTITCIKPVSKEQLAQLRTSENWQAEIRTAGAPGGYVTVSVADAVTGIAKLQERLTLIAETGEAVRREWLSAVRPFSERENGPNKFKSVGTFTHPTTGATSEEWFAATPEQLRGSKAPSLADLAKGPQG